MANKNKKPGFLRRNLDPFAPGSSLWNRLNAVGNDALLTIMGAGMIPMKKGGRVKGCGIAKRGFGRAMRKK